MGVGYGCRFGDLRRGLAPRIFAFLDASGLDGMLPGIVLAAVGSATFFGFLCGGLSVSAAPVESEESTHMMDPRIEPLARNLLGYSLETKPRGSD